MESTVTCKSDRGPKSVGPLKVLEKKPLENYFGGTREKGGLRRRVRPKRTVYNLSNLAEELHHIVDGKPVAGADPLSKREGAKMSAEEVEDRLLQLKIYEHSITREINNRKNYEQHRLEEETYIKQLEYLAESWMSYREKMSQKKQQSASGFRGGQKGTSSHHHPPHES